MKLLLISLVCLTVVVNQLASAGRHSNSFEWSLFKKQHGKSYASAEEEARRFANFLATKTLIERHNADPRQSYKMGLNHMADWSHEERDKLNGLKTSPIDTNHYQQERAYVEAFLNDGAPLPDEVDWRQVPGRVSEVKDQGKCGSCWAFSTVGLLEGQELKNNLTRNLIELSEQDIVDCSQSNYGCLGGYMHTALRDLSAIGGIESEQDYPYVGQEGKCKYVANKSVMKVAKPVGLKNEDEMKVMVAKYGPIAAAMYFNENCFAYKSGVYSDKSCLPNKVSHAILIVGYGTDPKEGDYWLIKNSFGKTWGDKGYFKLKRGVDMCSIAFIPTIAKY